MSNCSIRYFISSSSPPPSSHRRPEETTISDSALAPASPSPSASKDALILLTLFQIPTALLTFGLTAGSFYVFTRSKRVSSAATSSVQEMITPSGKIPRQAVLQQLERLEVLSNKNQLWLTQLEEKVEKNNALGVDSTRLGFHQIRSLVMKDHDRFRGSLSRIEKLLQQLPQLYDTNQTINTFTENSPPPFGGIKSSIRKPLSPKESIWEAARDSSPFVYGQHHSIDLMKPPVDPTLTKQSTEEKDPLLRYTSAFQPRVRPSGKVPDKVDTAQWFSLFDKKKQKQKEKKLGAKAELKRAKREAEEEEDRVIKEEKEWKAQKRGWTEDSEPAQKSFVLVNTDNLVKTVISNDPVAAKPSDLVSNSVCADDSHLDKTPKVTDDKSKLAESKIPVVAETAHIKPFVASEADPLPARQTKDTKPQSLDRSSTSQTSLLQPPQSDVSAESFPSSNPSSAPVAARSEPKTKITANVDTNTTASAPLTSRPCFKFGLQPHSLTSAFGLHPGKPYGSSYEFTYPFTRAETAVEKETDDKAGEHERPPLGKTRTYGQGCSYWTIVNGVRVRRVSSWRR